MSASAFSEIQIQTAKCVWPKFVRNEFAINHSVNFTWNCVENMPTARHFILPPAVVTVNVVRPWIHIYTKVPPSAESLILVLLYKNDACADGLPHQQQAAGGGGE